MAELILKDEVYAAIGAAMAVHSELGHGFLEAVYQEAMEFELSARRIPFASHPSITIYYRGVPLKKAYTPDLLCFGQIVVELKASEKLTDIDRAQLLNYLRATGSRVGLLVNFGSRHKLEWERIVL